MDDHNRSIEKLTQNHIKDTKAKSTKNETNTKKKDKINYWILYIFIWNSPDDAGKDKQTQQMLFLLPVHGPPPPPLQHETHHSLKTSMSPRCCISRVMFSSSFFFVLFCSCCCCCSLCLFVALVRPLCVGIRPILRPCFFLFSSSSSSFFLCFVWLVGYVFFYPILFPLGFLVLFRSCLFPS